MTEFTRMTVVGSTHRAELVVPDDEPMGGLIPRLMELLQEPTGPLARPLTLVRATGEQVDAALSAAQQQLLDGEQLRLVRSDDAPPPPEVADVTDVVGDTFAQRPGRWNDSARMTVGAGTVAVATGVAVHALRLPPVPGLSVVAVLVLLGLVLGRLTGPGRTWPVLALTAAAVGAAVPVGLAAVGLWQVGLGQVGPGQLGPWSGSPPTLWAGVATVTVPVWLVLGLGFGVGLRQRVALVGAGLGALLSLLTPGLVLLGVDPLPAVGVAGTAATVAAGLLPWYALSTSGLTGLDDQVLAGRPSGRRTVTRTVDEAYRALSWSAAAVAVSVAGCSLALASADSIWPLLLGVDITLLAALRTRAFPLIVQQVPLAGAAVTGAAVAVLSRGLPTGPLAGLLIGLALLTALAVGVRPPPHVRARLRRLGNLVEAIGVIALLPLLLGVFGVYGDLIAAFR